MGGPGPDFAAEREQALAELELEKDRPVREAKARIRRNTAELKRRRRENKVAYFAPHGKQVKFIEASRTFLRRLLLGGNRSGKTEIGIAEDVAHALGYRPWLPEDHPDYKIDIKVPNVGTIVAESFTEQVVKTILPKLLGDLETRVGGMIPKHMIKSTKKNQSGVITRIVLTNGSIINIKSYDQEDALFESDAADWVHLDEPPPYDIYIAILRSLVDSGGPMWMTLTPLKEAWIFDDLVSNPKWFKIYVDIQDNVGHGLTQAAVDSFLEDLTEDEKEMRAHGRFFHLTGLVYKEYRPDIHRIGRWTNPNGDNHLPPTWSLYLALDTHFQTPHHATYMAVRPDNHKIVVGEVVNRSSQNLVSDMVLQMRTYEAEVLGVHDNHRFSAMLIDALSKTNDPRAGGNLWDDFAEAGYVCEIGSKTPDQGILKVRKLLKHDPSKGIFTTLHFYDDLPATHWQFSRYMWDDWQKQTRANKNAKETAKKKDDHIPENIHRLVCYGMVPLPINPYFDSGGAGGVPSVGASEGY